MSLDKKNCTPCQSGAPPLNNQKEEQLIKEISGWSLKREGVHRLEKSFTFEDFDETMRFVNAVASIAKQENHHPAMHVSYGTVRIDLSTHKIGGLSENDFILAAKIDKVVPQYATTGV
jgi:4a-hydroxytetrahydrobiopterin dehydratase